VTFLQNVVDAQDGERPEHGARNREQPDMPRIMDRTRREQDGGDNAERQNNKSRREGEHKRLHGTLDDQRINWSGIAKTILAAIEEPIAAVRINQNYIRNFQQRHEVPSRATDLILSYKIA
jgi:hypothetical protein